MADCPIIGKDVPLTEKEVEKFCSYGCSVDCDIFLAEYIEKRDKKEGAAHGLVSTSDSNPKPKASNG